MLDGMLPQGSKRRKFVASLFSTHIPDYITKNYKKIGQASYTELEASLRQHYFSKVPKNYFESEQGKHDLDAHLSGRLENTRTSVVPWLNYHKSLVGSNILEIGCGTGSDAVALAEQGAKVTAIDVDENALQVARERSKLYDLTITYLQANATEVHNKLNGQNYDIIIFYAALEHMTHEERIAAMSTTWNMLKPDSLWCIVETPNRLWYYDHHTTHLPFLLWLPDDLAFKYSRFSPRSNFREIYQQENENTKLHFLRRGRGVSFHEFELSMKPAAELHVLSSMSLFYRQRNFFKNAKSRFSARYRYESFLATICPHIHKGFFQQDLDLIIKKN